MSTGRSEHALRVCVFAESSMISRIDTDELLYMEIIDLLCEQLYFDRLGHGINGVRVTRPRR